MASFPDTDKDGIANVPVAYSKEQGRKVVEDSKNLWDLIKKPNKYTIIIAAVVILFILLVVLVIRLVVKLVKRKSRKK